VTEVVVALLPRLSGRPFHLGPVIAMKGIAVDIGGIDMLAPENLLECFPD
jgi:hypothetical protein